MITINEDKIKSYLPKSKNNNDIGLFYNLRDGYYNYTACNNFKDLKCPCCKNKGCLSYHKEYSRNITIDVNGVILDEIINITIVKCDICSKKENCQKYNALLPFYILPYHIYTANIIINCIYEKIIEQEKIDELLEKYRITPKLLYDWIRKFRKYSLPSSIVLKVNNVISDLINKMRSLSDQFLSEFFLNFEHPFFLFRLTCVPLCIDT